MEPVKSTKKILAFKVLNRTFDNIWVDWAVEMMSAGFDTEHLRILAGEFEPFNQFEMQDLTTKVLNELNIDFSDKEKIINDYCCYLVDKALSDETQIMNALDYLKDLCMERNYEKSLFDFYLLYFAKEDLIDSEIQWHWPGATRNNIDNIINDCFIEWKSKHCSA